MPSFPLEHCARCGTEHRLSCPLDLCKCGHHYRAHHHGHACAAAGCACKKLWRRLNMVGVEKENPMPELDPEPATLCVCGHTYQSHRTWQNDTHPPSQQTVCNARAQVPDSHEGGTRQCGCTEFDVDWTKGSAPRVDANDTTLPQSVLDAGQVDPTVAQWKANPSAVLGDFTDPDPCRCGHGAGLHSHVDTVHQVDGDARCLATSCPCGAYVDALAHHWPDEIEASPHPNDYICHCGHTSNKHRGTDGKGECRAPVKVPADSNGNPAFVDVCKCKQLTAPGGNNPDRDPNFWFPGTECAKAECSRPRKRHGTILCGEHWLYWSSGKGRRAGWERIGDWVVATNDTTPPTTLIPPDESLMPPDASMGERCARCHHQRKDHHKPSAPFPGVCTAKHGASRIGPCACRAFVGHDWAASGLVSGFDTEGKPLWPSKITAAANVAGEASGLESDRAALMAQMSTPEQVERLNRQFVVPSEVLDPEFAAMHAIVAALKTLDSDARYRVLEYIKARYR